MTAHDDVQPDSLDAFAPGQVLPSSPTGGGRRPRRVGPIASNAGAQLDLLESPELKRRPAPSERPNLAKRLRSFGYRFTTWDIWSDFIAIAAITIANSIDRRPLVWREREDQFLKIVAKYKPDEVNVFMAALGDTIRLLEEEPRDVLGQTFMELGLGSRWAGQFFTPSDIGALLAAISLTDANERIARQGFVTLSEPAVGGGAIVIGAYNALLEQGLNPQRQLHVTAGDIDLRAVHMAYIQLSLLHIPGVITHGNSLSLEMRSTWLTPAHILGGWDAKLRHWRATDAALELISSAQAP